MQQDVVPGAIASSLVILRARPQLNQRFLLAYLNSPIGKAAIANYENGSAQPNLGARDVAKFQIPLPPLAIQRKIAAVLASFDDLIEINNRRVNRLQEMARRIYHEWFVDYRYPGHEAVAMVDSEFGPIPHGFAVRRLSELADLVRGRSYRSDELVS